MAVDRLIDACHGHSADQKEWPQKVNEVVDEFDQAICDDLGTPLAMTAFEELLALKKVSPHHIVEAFSKLDEVLAFGFKELTRADLRIRPKSATLTEADIEAALTARKTARAAKDFATSDRIRDDLITKGVEIMDGDPLGWDWKLTL
jgi:cysteinyl-tRNA synthetase